MNVLLFSVFVYVVLAGPGCTYLPASSRCLSCPDGAHCEQCPVGEVRDYRFQSCVKDCESGFTKVEGGESLVEGIAQYHCEKCPVKNCRQCDSWPYGGPICDVCLPFYGFDSNTNRCEQCLDLGCFSCTGDISSCMFCSEDGSTVQDPNNGFQCGDCKTIVGIPECLNCQFSHEESATYCYQVPEGHCAIDAVWNPKEGRCQPCTEIDPFLIWCGELYSPVPEPPTCIEGYYFYMLEKPSPYGMVELPRCGLCSADDAFGEGCIQCFVSKYFGSCSKCGAGFSLVDAGGGSDKCINSEIVVPQCEVLDNNGMKCLECVSGYWHSEMGDECYYCLEHDINCLRCDSVNCIECVDGMDWVGDVCLTCDPSGMTDCIKCREDYCTECVVGKFLDKSTGTCVGSVGEAIPGCNSWDPVEEMCDGCETGYFLLVDECHACNTYVGNCETCSFDPVVGIPICDNCGDGYYYFEMALACFTCDGNDCGNCDDPEHKMCTTCIPDFYLAADGNCYDCSVYDEAEACLECNDMGCTQFNCLFDQFYNTETDLCEACAGCTFGCSPVASTTNPPVCDEECIDKYPGGGCLQCDEWNCFQWVCNAHEWFNETFGCMTCGVGCVDCQDGGVCYDWVCPPGEYFMLYEGCLPCEDFMTKCTRCYEMLIPGEPLTVEEYCLECVDGFYLDEDFICKSCPVGDCKICQNAETCDECNTGSFLFHDSCVPCNEPHQFKDMLPPATCYECPNGMYKDSGVCKHCDEAPANCVYDQCVNTGECLECEYEWGTGLFGHCYDCPTLFPGSTNCTDNMALECDDLSGYYLDEDNDVCYLCSDYDCQICDFLPSKGVSCLLCELGFRPVTTLGVTSCVACDVGCADCNDTTCFGCMSRYYYDSVKKICENCGPYCLLCDDVETISENGECNEFSCELGYVRLADQKCYACDDVSVGLYDGCLECYESGAFEYQCGVCDVGYHILIDEGITICGLCDIPGCLGCNEGAPITTCESCDEMAGYVNVNGECHMCIPNCQSCDWALQLVDVYGNEEDMKYDCVQQCFEIDGTSLFKAAFQIGEQFFPQLRCVRAEECPQGTWANPATKECEPCPMSECAMCSKQNGECQMCNFGYALEMDLVTLNPVSCTLDCGLGFAPADLCKGVCMEGQIYCIPCAGDMLADVTGGAGYFVSRFYNFDGCVFCDSDACYSCEPGYFLDGIVCKKCGDFVKDCAECSNEVTCTACDSTNENTYLNDEGLCVLCELQEFDHCDAACSGGGSVCLNCEPGYYWDNFLMICANCTTVKNGDCSICIDDVTCSDCKVGSFFDATGDPSWCAVCAEGCAVCSVAGECDTGGCSVGWEFDDGGGNSLCSRCSDIDPQCVECGIVAGECDLCNDGFVLSGDGVSCGTCYDGMFVSLDGTTCLLKCPDGQISDPDSQCRACTEADVNCLECNYLVLVDNVQCTKCGGGTDLDLTSGECVLCTLSTGCSECSAMKDVAGINYLCTVCEVGFWFAQGNCYDHATTDMSFNGIENCAVGYRDHLGCDVCNDGYMVENDVCVPCESYFSALCQTCEPTKCLECKPRFVMDANGRCRDCNFFMPGCVDCTDRETCTTCVDGLYLDNSPNPDVCAVCPLTCTQCTDMFTCQECVVGNFLRFDNSMCSTVCPIDYYGQMGLCLRCPTDAITIAETADFSDCVCPAGSYFDSVKNYCVLCGFGEYKFATGLQTDTCVTCYAHSDTVAMGSTLASECLCEPGYEWDADTTSCVQCPVDTYKSVLTDMTCRPCPANSVTEGALGANKESECVCDAFFFRNSSGDCVPCPAGSYFDSVTNYCVLCGFGEYKLAGLQTGTCVTCYAHSDTVAMGSTLASECLCEPGYEWDADTTSCVQCPVDTYKSVLTDMTCRPCPANSVTEGALGADKESECVCDAFFFRNSSGDCVPCPAGSYFDSVTNYCVLCGFGEYKLAGLQTDTCVTCYAHSDTVAMGSTLASDCLCEPGYEWDADTTSCVQCPVDTYKSDLTDMTCGPCPANSVTEGALGADKESECVCDAFFFRDSSGDCVTCPVGLYKGEPSDKECGLCPEGFYCNAGERTACAAGTFSDSDSVTIECEECPMHYYCPGGEVIEECKEEFFCPPGSSVQGEACKCHGHGQCLTEINDCDCFTENNIKYSGKDCTTELLIGANLLTGRQSAGIGIGTGAGIAVIAVIIVIIIAVVIIVVFLKLMQKKKKIHPVQPDAELLDQEPLEQSETYTAKDEEEEV